MNTNFLTINNVYQEKSNGRLVVFLGYQYGCEALRDLAMTHGFFRELNDPNTFFGLKLTEVQHVAEPLVVFES